MRYETFDCKNENSNDNANIKLYLIDSSPESDIITRPIVIICPGGGYSFIADREAEIIAMQFLSMGYHAAVLNYSVAPAVFPTAMLELAKSIIYIRENAIDFNVEALIDLMSFMVYCRKCQFLSNWYWIGINK